MRTPATETRRPANAARTATTPAAVLLRTPALAAATLLAPAVAAATLLGATLAFAADDGAEVTRFTFEMVEGRAAVEPGRLTFRAFGQDFALDLSANDELVARGAKVVVVGDGATEKPLVPSAWVGRDAARPDVEARLVIEEGAARGYVRSTAGTFVFEPSGQRAAGEGLHEVRRAEEVLAAADPLPCGADPAEVLPAPPAAAGETRAVARETMRTLGVSVVADAAFYRRFGDQSVVRMQALLNEVDGVFRADLGAALQIVQVMVYTTDASQPFPANAAASETLAGLSAARAADPQGTLSLGGVTHLFSGRGLDGPSGIAWIAGVCDAYYGAGVSSITSNPGFLETVLVAHEIGHNLGASHDGPSGYGCETTPFGWIMWPVLASGLDDTFSACSVARIARQFPLAPCIAAGELPELTCGNGELDEGEDCDDGNMLSGDCCRSDCRLEAYGMPCGESADACYDAVCDGSGACIDIPNEAPCASDDACMVGRCSQGVCATTEEPRAFQELSANFRLDAAGVVRSAKMVGSVEMYQCLSDPCSDGFRVYTSVGDQTAYDEFIPGDRWMLKGPGNYAYKAVDPEPGTVASAKIRFATLTGRAVFKLKMAAPMVGMAPEPAAVRMLAGNEVDGQCGSVERMRCMRKGSTYRCW